MAREDGGGRRISPTASSIMLIAIGVVLAYVGVRLLVLSVSALRSGETLIMVGAGVLGALLVAAPLVVLASELRARVGRRGR